MKSKYILIGFLSSVFLIISSCEDDPLLAPQTGTEEEAGSYGNLTPLQKLDDEKKVQNPKIF